MRRILLGEESRFAESTVGRITIAALFTTLVGVILSLVFLLNGKVNPVALKYAIVAATGLAAGFSSRRLLPGRHAIVRAVSALLALVVAFIVLHTVTRGFIGLSLRAGLTPFGLTDAVLQLFVSAASAWLAQLAWGGARREVMVEPRYEPELIPAQPAPRPVRRAQSRVQLADKVRTLSSRVRTKFSSAVTWTQHKLTPAGARPRVREARPAKTKHPRRRASQGIALAAEEQHVCPYCLEPVRKRDPRGVTICKVCKTWHHADCWAITGVCQVPHQYES